MESDELNRELEGQNETNEDILIGFADEGDEEVQDAASVGTDDSSYAVDTPDEDDDDDESLDSDSDFDVDGPDDDTMKTNEHGEHSARTRPNVNAGASTSTDDQDEDDVIAKILANIKTPRIHPPDINIDDYVVDLTFHPDNDILVAGTISGDALVYKYSVDENVLVNTLELHVKAIRDIEFDYDGRILFSASKDRSVLLTDLETGKFQRCYEHSHEVPLSKINVFDRNMFASGDDDGVVKMWDIRDRSNDPIMSLKEVDDYITAILTNDARKILLATSGDGFLTAFNIGAR